MAKGTVVNGPLNWLHEARHIIGTLAKADYVDPARPQARPTQQGDPAAHQPHITATAAIWKWIYPDEAYVVQQASDQNSSGTPWSASPRRSNAPGPKRLRQHHQLRRYMAGAACEHVTQRASVRQFVNPVFLGGAVIVPPTRPGWAEADASVMNTANLAAEAAFEQAGQPDVTASTGNS
jgi:hypothetical protein